MCLEQIEQEQSVRSEHRYSRLTPKEYNILSVMMDEPGKIFSAEEIYRTAWQAEPFDCHLVISVHIRHLREKIERDPSHPSYIQAFWGRGYRLNPDA
jgi:DNA-binding response OmpR family regulator